MVEIVFTVVLEVAKCLAPSTERQFSYVRNYTSNFENLRTEVKKLKDDSVSVQHTVNEAERNGDEIEKNVEEWLASVNQIITQAEKFIGDEETANKRCFKGLCPNLKTRHRLSKKAVRQLEAIVKLREAGRFDKISYRTVPEDTCLLSNKDYEVFESRMSTLKDIVGALKNPNVIMLGIYGMGGIGKTTLAKEVARNVVTDKLFDQVVFAEVSQGQDIRKIQGEIADKLGLKFDEESQSGRARRLCNRLKKEKTILVILDNIWENLDLQAVGIPLRDDHMGCKVLLTARSEDVLSRKMDTQHNFSVGVLKEEEAWSLFKKMAGDYVEGSKFKSVATDVAKECAGLPVSVVTVARALRNKRLFEWQDALEQLRRPFLVNFKDIQASAYSAIELSYNKLEGEELKKIFLLIGYTYVKSIDSLLMYGMGLSIFQGINKVEEARARVCTLVSKLKSCCLLLDEDLSMHDVVRDVAISIASIEHNVFMTTNQLVDRREWSGESEVKLYTSIVLRDVKTNMLPEVLEYPQLKLLSIHAEHFSYLAISDNLFSKMREVKVLDLAGTSLPSSLPLLTNLRTLCLNGCMLQHIHVIGDLKKLEILCFQSYRIKQLPIEVGGLTQLKLLDLRGCRQLEIIPPSALSNLSHLEELYVGDSDIKWELEGQKNASLEELKKLPNLTSLEIHIKYFKTISRGLFLEKLERYKICIGGSRDMMGCSRVSRCPTISGCSRVFQLKLPERYNCWNDGLIVQLQRIEELHLNGLDVKGFVYELLRVGSLQLRYLNLQRQEGSTTDMRTDEIILEDDVHISNSLFVEKIAIPNLETLRLGNVNVESIWQSQLAAMSCGIQTITTLILHCCLNLRSLFSSSIASSFARLQHLEIYTSPFLKEIIVVGEEEKKNLKLKFPQLQFLKMEDLDKLTSFCTGDLPIEFPSLKELEIEDCSEFTIGLTKQVFPKLEVLRFNARNIPTICQFPEDFLFEHMKSFCVELDESTTISSLDFLQRFHSMKFLKLYGSPFDHGEYKRIENGMKAIIKNLDKCCALKHILIQESSNMDNLVTLEVSYCNNLINLVPSSTSFRNLTALDVWTCRGLINVLTSSTAKSLVRLKEMRISGCNMITEIVAVADEQGDNAAKDEIVFSELEKLTLSNLQILTNFCSGNCAFKFPSLEFLIVNECPNMKIFNGGELSTHKLHKVQTTVSILEKKRWTWKDDLNTTIQQLYLELMEEDEKRMRSSPPKENEKEEDAKDSGSKGVQINKEDSG